MRTVVSLVVAPRVRRRAIAGALAIAAGLLGVAVLAPVAFAGAVGVEARLPANAAANPKLGLASVSCASAGNCTAVGVYGDTSRSQEGLLLGESSGSWARGVEAPLLAHTAANPNVVLDSVSCGSMGNCTAVGTYTPSPGEYQGLLLSESSGSWARGVEAPLPANAAANPRVGIGISVSCASPGNCTAVGDYTDTSGDEQGLLLSESSGSWVPAEAVLPANAAANPEVELGSVSCASAGNCSAVGYYTDTSGDEQGLLLSESSGSWVPTEAVLPANAAAYPGVVVGSVSCASAGNCTAVGHYTDTSGSDRRGLLLTESAGSWSPGVEAPLGANPGTVTSVSCASVGNCTAVGSYDFPPGPTAGGFLLRESSGSWSPGVAAPLPANASPNPGLPAGPESVGCVSAGNCGAAGEYVDSSDNGQGLVLSESSGSWTADEAVLPADAAANPNAVLGPIQCTSAGSCTALGMYEDTSGHQQGLLETFGPGVPVISRLRLVPRQASLGRNVRGRCVKPTESNKTRRLCRRPIEVKIRYTLTIAARVTITLKRQTPGRSVRGGCVSPTEKNKRRRKCARTVAVPGSITRTARAGSDSFTLNGKIGGKLLGRGVYQLSAVPIANGVAGAPRRATFTIGR